MKQQATVEKLAAELTEARASYEQLKRQLFELGCKTSRMYRALDELRAEAPSKAAPDASRRRLTA